MTRQNHTGFLTERFVKDRLADLGLIARKPVPDVGVDFVVTSPRHPDKAVKLQVKGRGARQTNKRYRWFQIRTTPNQRLVAAASGLPLADSWKKKVALVDAFVFVALRYRECWIFEAGDIERLVTINRTRYGNRRDNKDGCQTEIDLGIRHQGRLLTEIYREHLNNWDPVITRFI